VYVEFGDIQGEMKRIDQTIAKGRKTRKTVKGMADLSIIEELSLNSEEGDVKSAILLITCQNEFLHPKGKLYNKVQGVMSSLGTEKHLKDLVEAATESHAMVIHAPVAINKTYGSVGFDEWTLSQMEGMFVPGSWNSELYEDTPFNPEDILLPKRHAPDCVTGTNLLMTLKSAKIDRLFIAGFLTDVTVENTVKELAKQLKGKVSIHPVSDATATFTMDAQKVTFKTVLPKYSTPVTTDEAVSMLSGSQ